MIATFFFKSPAVACGGAPQILRVPPNLKPIASFPAASPGQLMFCHDDILLPCLPHFTCDDFAGVESMPGPPFSSTDWLFTVEWAFTDILRDLRTAEPPAQGALAIFR